MDFGNAFWGALVGAFVGTLTGGMITYLFQLRAHRRAERLRDWEGATTRRLFIGDLRRNATAPEETLLATLTLQYNISLVTERWDIGAHPVTHPRRSGRPGARYRSRGQSSRGMSDDDEVPFTLHHEGVSISLPKARLLH